MSRFVGTVAAIAALGAAAHAADPKAMIEPQVAAFEEALARGDSAALAAAYGEGAVVMPPGGGAVTGTGAIDALWRSVIDSGVARADLVTDDVMKAGGGVLIETGRFAMFDKAGQSAGEGKYVVVWEKQNGEWKIVRDIWNEGK